MKKNYLLITMMCFCFSFAGNAEVKNAMGFLISDETNPVGLYSFPMNDATRLVKVKETSKVSAGAWIKGVYYGATYKDSSTPLNWCKINLETGQETIIAPLTGTKRYTDMSYDYSTGKLYAISHPESTTTRISIVNPDDGKGETVLDTDIQLLTLACSYDGTLYGIDPNGLLYSIDKVTHKIVTIGNTGFKPNYTQSMEFDHDTETLYWAACNDNSSHFFTVDIHTATATRISDLADKGEITGLYIPFTQAHPDAPGAVGDLIIESLSDRNAIKITFVFPTTTASEAALASMKSLNVECDGVMLKSYVNGVDFSFTAGEKKTIELDAPAGLHLFKVYVANDAGVGVPMIVKTFVGKDVPAAPQNLQAEVQGRKVKLTWDAVTTGLSGGEIDKTSLTYTIVRHPDNVTVAEGVKVNALEDEVSEMNVYSYEVTAYTAQGKGGSVQGEWKAMGDACTIPFAYGFDNDVMFKLWTVIDNNKDGVMWTLSKTDESFPAARYRYSSSNEGDDWLITPPLNMKDKQAYKLKFTCGVQNPRYPERLKVTMGRTNTVAGQTIELGTYELNEYGLNPKLIYLPDDLEPGNWYIAFKACSDRDMSSLYLSDVEVVEDVMATLGGVVSADGQPLAGAVVSLGDSEKTVTTDSEGRFSIKEIEAGTYTLKVSLFGYEIFSKDLTFGALEKKKENVTLTALKKVTVSGTVKTEQGESIPDAAVYLHGYADYTVHTDKDGNFRLENVYCGGDYTLEAYAMNYDGAIQNVPAFAKDVVAGDLLLKEKLLTPSNIVAKASDAAVNLSWDRPEDKLMQFRYDDGEDPLYVLNMQLGATKDAVSGCIYDTPTVLTDMSWHVANNSDPKTTVDIIILDLDENGKPTKNILFEQKGVPSRDSYWSSFRFPYPIVAPRGAMVALQGDAFLCMDYGESTEWPVREGKSCYTFDYKNKGFTNVDGCNLLVRAEGIRLGAPHNSLMRANAPMPQPKYKVWRMAEVDMQNTTNWQLLTSEPIAATTFTDATWKDATKGTYKYAVKAIYTGNESSYPEYSGMVPKQMTGKVTVSLTTNAGVSAQAATLVLINEDNIHHYAATADENGKMAVSDTWEGNYTLVIEKEGFLPINEKLTVEGGKDIAKEYVLSEVTAAPGNLKISTNGTLGSRLFRWNVIEKWEDGFEGHDDFVVNSPGALGWSYIDGDGSETYAPSYYDFPHKNEPMAFITFNPSAPNPDLLDDMTAHSGNKLLCCFAGTNGKPNNDFIISPELEMDKDFIIRFWAESYHSRYLEEIRVGYSTTGKNQEDFIWIGDTREVPSKWTEYIMNIPKEAKYVTINCISDDCMILLLDDIYIGAPQVEKVGNMARVVGQPVSYEVYLDGTKVNTTTQTSYTFTDLAKGDHVAGVKAVFASGATSMSTIDFNVDGASGIEDEATENGITLYPLPVRDVLHIKGEYEEAQLVNPGGQVILHTTYTPTIQMNRYPAGIYYLIIKKEGKASVLKVPVK